MLVSPLFVTGCSSDSDTIDDTITVDDYVTGIWTQNCISTGPNAYTTSVLAFNNTEQYVAINSTYDNAGCANAALETEHTTGNYLLGNDTSTASGTAAKELDTTAGIINGISIPFSNREIKYSIVAVEGNQLDRGDDLSDPVLDGSTPEKRTITLLNSPYNFINNNANAYYFSGVWVSSCAPNDFGGLFSIKSYSFSVGGVSISNKQYNDSACTQLQSNLLSSADYKLEAASISSNEKPAIGINLTYRLYEGSTLAPSNYIDEYNIIYRDGNTLYLGDLDADPALDGSTPDNRPTALKIEALR